MTAREPRRRPPPQGWLECVGSTGWLPSESPAGMHRNRRLVCVGIRIPLTMPVPSLPGGGAAGLYRRSRHWRGSQGVSVSDLARACGGDAFGAAHVAAGRLAHDPEAALSVGIMTPIGNHSFRATGITAYLANGGALEHAQEMAAHESPRTTKLYDRTKERLTQDEVERIRH